MWIVLIDHSGSMGQPFKGESSFAGRSFKTFQKTKLEAAREALSVRILGLDPNEYVTLIGFTSTAEIIFQGPVGDKHSINNALNNLRATNGTSVATAFDCAHSVLQKSTGISRVLLVSDCQTDLEPAEKSANAVARHALIDVLLIDPSSSTERIARAIIRQGEVQAVTGTEELGGAVKTRDESAQQVAAAVERATRTATA